MPRKKSTIAPAKRMRDNQRRSRARKKDLVEDLQRQLRWYEEKEIQATLVMQRAARRVAWENSQLRALLASHGISRETVDRFISQQENRAVCGTRENSLHKGTPTSGAAPIAEARHLEAPQATNSISRAKNEAPVSKTILTNQKMRGTVEAETPFGEEMETLTQEGVSAPAIKHRYMQLVHTTEHLNELDAAYRLAATESILPPVSERLYSPPPTSSLARNDSLLGTMSCEVAAGIISGMRGDGDKEQTRSQLGCEGREDCEINNMRVLQVMEMY